ncbi:ABC transporter permease [Vibrio sinensis]|uniref:ABC transporter permease n=1 Tax=Vibrio sinensis TaxID=2302434 RepID=A0A3A6QML6_9VIBR|nr:ABC transporter permease [Vibrio sinensis]RJX73733.1 ABC transporter permease [Vibrio sinensis]
MNSLVDVSWVALLLFFSTLSAPLFISRYYQLKLEREMVLSVTRMSLQLLLVGAYLEYLFQLDNAFVNFFWIVIMLIIGASSIIGKTHLPKRVLMLPVIAGLSTGILPMLLLITLGIIQPTPHYSAQYLIPLAGMLLGNSLSCNIIALQNLFGAFQQRQAEYEAAISLGASVKYACLPFMRSAMQKSLAPALATMATTGLVTLPGMMTGQILSGASPLIAIKYQLLIMIAIFVMSAVSMTITLELSIKRGINHYGRVLITTPQE